MKVNAGQIVQFRYCFEAGMDVETGILCAAFDIHTAETQQAARDLWSKWATKFDAGIAIPHNYGSYLVGRE